MRWSLGFQPLRLITLSNVFCSTLCITASLSCAAGEMEKPGENMAESVYANREVWLAHVPDRMEAHGAFEFVEGDPALPDVLLMGDSISIGYTPTVRKELAGKANVYRVPENAGPTIRGLEQMEIWIGNRGWDVIHFNFGLHDLKYVERNGKSVHQVPVDEYGKNLEKIIGMLAETGATLLWGATTPVPEGSALREAADEPVYRETALAVMKKHDVAVNDLHKTVEPGLQELQLPQNVHFNERGYEVLGRAVADRIEKALRDSEDSKDLKERKDGE